MRDGDIVTVDPAAIALLEIPKEKEAKKKPEAKAEGETAEINAETAVEGEAAEPAAAAATTEGEDAVEAKDTAGQSASEAAAQFDPAQNDPLPQASEVASEEPSEEPSTYSSSRRGKAVEPLKLTPPESPQEKLAFMKAHNKPLAFKEHPFMRPLAFVPEYLEVNYNICSIVFLRAPTLHPGRCELPSPWPPEHHALTFEWYSRIYNRKTKRAPPEPLKIHGQEVRVKDKFRRILEREMKDRSRLFQRVAAEAERERILATGAEMITPKAGGSGEARL